MLYLSCLSNRAVNETSRSFPVSNLIADQDLFRQLGPEAVFSAKHDWSPPRTVHLTRRQHGDTGDSNTQVQGDCRQGIGDPLQLELVNGTSRSCLEKASNRAKHPNFMSTYIELMSI